MSIKIWLDEFYAPYIPITDEGKDNVSTKFFILYYKKETLYEYMAQNNLEGHEIFKFCGLKTLKQEFDLSDRIFGATRIILPDFHKNPEARSMLALVLKHMRGLGLKTDNLNNYYKKHFPKPNPSSRYNQHGLDVEQEIAAFLKAEIDAEILKQLLTTIKPNGTP